MLVNESSINHHQADVHEKLDCARDQIVQADLPSRLHTIAENFHGNPFERIHVAPQLQFKCAKTEAYLIVKTLGVVLIDKNCSVVVEELFSCGDNKN